MTDAALNADELDAPCATAWGFFECLNRGDVDGAFALLTDDGTFWSNGARKDMSRATAARLIGRVLDYVPIQMTLLRAMSSGDLVAFECESNGTSRDNTPYRNVYAFWIQLRAGRIQSIREHADTLYGSVALPAEVVLGRTPGTPA